MNFGVSISITLAALLLVSTAVALAVWVGRRKMQGKIDVENVKGSSKTKIKAKDQTSIQQTQSQSTSRFPAFKAKRQRSKLKNLSEKKKSKSTLKTLKVEKAQKIFSNQPKQGPFTVSDFVKNDTTKSPEISETPITFGEPVKKLEHSIRGPVVFKLNTESTPKMDPKQAVTVNTSSSNNTAQKMQLTSTRSSKQSPTKMLPQHSSTLDETTLLLNGSHVSIETKPNMNTNLKFIGNKSQELSPPSIAKSLKPQPDLARTTPLPEPVIDQQFHQIDWSAFSCFDEN